MRSTHLLAPLSLLAASLVLTVSAPTALAAECSSPKLLQGTPSTVSSLMPKIPKPKGEFETSAEFAARTAPRAPNSPLLVSVGDVRVNYDADAGHFVWDSGTASGLSRRYITRDSLLYSLYSDGDATLHLGKRVTKDSSIFSTIQEDLLLISRGSVKVPEKLETKPVPRDKAPAVKAGLRVVALIEPVSPYFVWGDGNNVESRMMLRESAVSSEDSQVRELTSLLYRNGQDEQYEYRVILGNLLCLGILDRSGKVLGSWGAKETEDAAAAARAAAEAAAAAQAAAKAAAEAAEAAVAEAQAAAEATERVAALERSMIRVPGGAFLMGSPRAERGRFPNEGPQRSVSIQPFEVSKYEVTWAEYAACVSAGSCAAANDDGFGKGDRPVTNVRWDDANNFVSWLSRETGKSYRLLSEAEWEYAARAGTTTAYSFGDSISNSQANFSGGSGKPEPVGSYPANAFGLHDMHGSVGEWVQDCFADSYSANQSTDGRPYNSGSCTYRVYRGGAWNVSQEEVRSAYRRWGLHLSRGSALGFRVARTL